MKRKEFNITQENICSVNDYLKKLFRINRRKDMVAPFARCISVLLYLIVSCVLLYGIGCQIEKDMSGFPVLSDLWETLCSYIPIMDMEWYFFILTVLLILYVPTFIAPIIIHLIACLIYHPKDNFQELSGSEYEQAQILVENHKKAISYPKGLSWLPSFIEENMVMVFSITFTVIPCLCSVIVSVITAESKVVTAIGGTITFALIGLALWFVTLPYWIWLIEFSFAHVKDKYLNAIDKYWLANDPQEVARREEAKKAAEARRYAREDEYISSMAKIYAREKKENEEYLKRLHEWATNGEDPTPGCGDGI